MLSNLDLKLIEKENEGKFFFIFYYNRDRVPECRDIWFVLEQK